MNGWLLAFYIIGAWILVVIIFLAVWSHLFARGRARFEQQLRDREH